MPLHPVAQAQVLRIAPGQLDRVDPASDSERSLLVFGEGEGEAEGGSLADRQRGLREELGRQRGLMPGRGTPEGEAAGREIDRAGRAMEDAEQALREAVTLLSTNDRDDGSGS